MVGIVLASHGEFAKGIKKSGAMVYGEQENVEAVSLMPNDGPDDFRKKLNRAIKKFDNQDEVLFLVDLWGGTPFNQSSALAEDHEKWAIVTGLNLPMLIEAYTARFDENVSAQEIATRVFIEGRKGVRTKPESLQPTVKDASAVSKVAEIPKGTKVGNGQMELVHVRIDSRLLHGQVATSWAHSVGCNRIIVVSDSVAHDKMRKTLITQAAPPGVKANVTTIKNMVRCYKDPRFGGCKALLLFENPEDVLAAQKEGLPLKHINIGTMAHSVGKTMLNISISVDETDVCAFLDLQKAGCTFDTKQVPSASSDDIFELIKKNHLMP